MLLPALSKAKAKAEGISCVNNLKQLQTAWMMYSTDNTDLTVFNGGGLASDLNQWVTGWLDWGSGIGGANTNTTFLTDGALGTYTARSLGVYKCPADKFPGATGTRIRSVSMNGFVGDHSTKARPSGTMGSVYGLTAYRRYLKTSHFNVPGSSQTWVFLDEHPDGINDGLFGMHMPATPPPVTAKWAAQTWDDVPASYHNGACGFSFADGHAEIKKWTDPNTKAPVSGKNNPSSSTGKISMNDNPWLGRRTSAGN